MAVLSRRRQRLFANMLSLTIVGLMLQLATGFGGVSLPPGQNPLNRANDHSGGRAPLLRVPPQTALSAFRFRKGTKPEAPASDEKPEEPEPEPDQWRLPSRTALSAFTFRRGSTSEPSAGEETPSGPETEIVQEPQPSQPKQAATQRLRRLKDLVWVRETLEDLTSAEFATAVEAAAITGDDQDQKRRKRAVDYEKLLTQLNKRIRDLGCSFPENPSRDTSFTCQLTPGVGSASEVYDDEQRQLILERLIQTRNNLIDAIQGYELEFEDEEKIPFEINLPKLKVELPREEEKQSAPGPRLYVRDDGTVDWDGALQDQAALRNFGSAVWARINGRDPETVNDDESSSSHGKKPAVTAEIVETTEIKDARGKKVELEAELAQLEVQHTALLNSAISAGQAVAQVNLATLEPELRNQITQSADSLEKAREQVSYHTLVYELERIYSYLCGELGNPAIKGYISLQDRLNIAEFGLLESQVLSFSRQLDEGEYIDSDVLAVVGEQLNDFKRRLGIDYLITGVSFDREAIIRWLSELLEQTKKTLAFYGKGCRLFWNDIVFTLSLITRAAQGYTLKPREVRTIRRTFKDVLTFIPFVIILLIPLSPVGHVLVFGAIQRFFPDFFPSCFTEQRQNLLQLYEAAEYSEFTIDENWNAKLSRVVEALFYIIANTTRSIYLKIKGDNFVHGTKGEERPPEKKINGTVKRPPNGAN